MGCIGHEHLALRHSQGAIVSLLVTRLPVGQQLALQAIHLDPSGEKQVDAVCRYGQVTHGATHREVIHQVARGFIDIYVVGGSHIEPPLIQVEGLDLARCLECRHLPIGRDERLSSRTPFSRLCPFHIVEQGIWTGEHLPQQVACHP